MDTQNPNETTEQSQVSTPIKTNNSSDTNIDTDSIMKFIKDMFGKSLDTFKNPKLMMPLLIAGGVSWIIALLPIAIFFIFPPLLLIAVPAALILSILFSFSMANISLQAAKGNVPSINDATKPLPRVINYIVTYIKIFIQFIVRLFQPPFIIPGFKYVIGASLFMLENLENNTSNDQAVKKSLEITKGNLLNIFCLILTLVIISFILGLIPLSIATIVTAPFTTLCVAHTYLQLKK